MVTSCIYLITRKYLILERKKMFRILRYPVPQFSLFFGFPKRKDSASASQWAKIGKNLCNGFLDSISIQLVKN